MGPLVVAVVVIAAAGAAPVGAQQAEAVPPEPTPVADRSEEASGWLRAVVGDSPDRDRLIGGLWAMHPFEPHFPELDGTSGFGGVWGHWFGATFVNSYGERTFILGVERSWLGVHSGPFGVGTGYRVGVITGYDERLMDLARHTPLLPFAGLLVWARLGPVGLDSYYVYRAITLEASLVL